jgi:hypothetical protein
MRASAIAVKGAKLTSNKAPYCIAHSFLILMYTHCCTSVIFDEEV